MGVDWIVFYFIIEMWFIVCFKVLNEKFMDEIDKSMPNMFPDQYFTCRAECLSCRCERSIWSFIFLRLFLYFVLLWSVVHFKMRLIWFVFFGGNWGWFSVRTSFWFLALRDSLVIWATVYYDDLWIYFVSASNVFWPWITWKREFHMRQTKHIRASIRLSSTTPSTPVR